MAATVDYDAVVVGAGPNGLAAAITLAQSGASVLVLEAAGSPGGGTRSAELTLPGFVHDVCSAVHPIATLAPFLNRLALGEHGLVWDYPEIDLAHPLDDGPAAMLVRSIDRTGEALGTPRAYRRLIAPLLDAWDRGLGDQVLGPAMRLPKAPNAFARFGVRTLLPPTLVGSLILRDQRGAGLFAGLAAHSFTDLAHPLAGTGAALVFAVAAHHTGWPVVRGGSERITDAMVSLLTSLGGKVETNRQVAGLGELPSCRVVLFDTSPRQLVAIAGGDLSPRYRRRLERFRPGPGSFKLDYALDGPMPWKSEACRRAGTVHLGATIEEIVRSERDVVNARVPDRPFVLVAQQSIIDPTRAPEGKHTLWAYCHVPAGCEVDMTDRIEAQLERFAPGFRDLVLAKVATSPTDLASYNANYLAGDIAGGANTGLQAVFRPTFGADPYRAHLAPSSTGPGLFLCSASTPPGAGVHGMCGDLAARSALRFMGFPDQGPVPRERP
ncbi:MAG: NAD(P)/FAD-dependent oxidoreductase [Actinobacteria bacterium]|nr:NAD(P)/FAD-dependent oxidoreductase [Actinomycetota bacterium]